MSKEKKFIETESVEKAEMLMKFLDEKQGDDISILDVRSICSITDCVMIVTAKGVRHAQSLADYVLEHAKKEKIEYLGMEGYQGGDWILIDLNDVLIHVFIEEVRQFYNIEGLFSEAKQIYPKK